ncbi:ABC transporter permease [Homoserinibacter sp. YIM 151385]|uniref:ABC transporter permease n=1 Tax=Homoserinibacter sp. YIM 151385 TaxID=2985506 RepID=UPI0022F00FBB|nr:ABC transporter permease [Homoserinibacter sp. YIM 151385]WBU37613.1 FtsX-like permease family protein [Homoserinibacter sp. YIM 151385]
MYFTYLRRELRGRIRQTIVVASGMALAIALVIIVSAVSAGVKEAQAASLAAVYGVGTDVTVSEAQEPGEGGGPQQFDFGSGDGEADDEGARRIEQNTLRTRMGAAAFEASALETVRGLDGVGAATATLALQSTSFSGELPDAEQLQQGGGQGGPGSGGSAPAGGADGAGGSSFGIDSFDVLGIDPAATEVGPMTSAELADGRLLAADDAGAEVAVLDQTYADSAELAVGDTIEVGDAELEIVGLVASTSSDAETASDVYLPLDTAQTLAELDGQVTGISVAAASSDQVDAVQAEIEEALPDATVSTQAELASSVSGSLATASSLVSGLGTWLSIIVLAAAFLIATLFTISGVGRRTREFGTLKAIGWRNGRIVRQVAGESLVQGLIGGLVGVALGVGGAAVIGMISPTLTSAAASSGGPGGMGGPGGGGGGPAQQAASTAEVVLTAPVTAGVVLLAVGLAILGGLLAGAIGGWRAARLRPAEALRSVA